MVCLLPCAPGHLSVPLRGRVQAGVLGAVAVGTLLAATPARADFSVCNDSFDVLNVALARDAGAGFVSQGWWTLSPNHCAVLLHGEIDSRYFYLHAMDVFGRPVLTGEAEFCIAEQRFVVPGAQDCWQRGHMAGGFAEIDTGQARHWIVFLTEESDASR